ncbi:MAG: hypothetical protein ABWY33_10725 [Cellulomonas sp.]
MNAPWWRLAADSQRGQDPTTAAPEGTDGTSTDLTDLLPPFVD